MQRTTTRQSIGYEAARAIVDAAIAKASSLSLAISVIVVDESGIVKAFGRMDGAPLISVSASRQKALTAVGFGLKTGDDWYQFMKDDPIMLLGAQHLDHFILLGGGAPLKDGDVMVGAVGVSGGHYAMDEKCVEAAISAFQRL